MLLTARVLVEATSNAFWGCGVDMRVVRKSTPEDLFSNGVDGKNYLGWIFTLIHTETMGNFYWLPLLKKLPPSMVEGFQEVKNILAEKGLTHCPPITRSDLEIEHLAAAAAQAPATGAAMGETQSFCPLKSPMRAKSKREAVTDLDPNDLRILQMVECNSVCTLFEYYKLGLSMGVPDQVLTRNTMKTHRVEMLVLARLLNSELDILDFFCDYLNRHVLVNVRQVYENKRSLLPLNHALNMDDWQPTSSTYRKQTIFEYALFCFMLIVCTVDHLNHANAIEPNDEERKLPTSLDLMQFENGDGLVNSRYDILVNEFLFQLGFRIDYLKRLGEKMFQDCDPHHMGHAPVDVQAHDRDLAGDD